LRVKRFKNPKIVVNVEPWTKETLPEKIFRINMGRKVGMI
jgi:hypothetical protein